MIFILFFKEKKECDALKKYFKYKHWLLKYNKSFLIKYLNDHLLNYINKLNHQEVCYLLKILLLEKDFDLVLSLTSKDHFLNCLKTKEKNHEPNYFEKTKSLQNFSSDKKIVVDDFLQKENLLIVLKDIEENDIVLYWIIICFNSQNYLCGFQKNNIVLTDQEYEKTLQIFKQINLKPHHLKWLQCFSNKSQFNLPQIENLLIDLELNIKTTIHEKKKIKKI